MIELSDEDLLARMKNFEDHFVERKTSRDDKDWLKTVIAFANSAPVGLPCVLYIGVRDNGEIETPQRNLDEIQREFNGKLRKAYPRVPYVPKILSENGKQALAIIVPGSALRPHFAGPSYVRVGSETLEASEQQFNELVASRNSKARTILCFKGKAVVVVNRLPLAMEVRENHWSYDPIVEDCNQWWVTLKQLPGGAMSTFPLDDVTLSFETSKKTLLIYLAR